MATKKTKAHRYEGFWFKQRSDEAAPTLAVFRAPVEEVLSWAKIERLGPKTRGVQREQKEAKVDAIRKFLQADPTNTIPTAVILAFKQGAARVEGQSESASWGHVVVDGSKGAATVIDGQHRLIGIDAFDPQTDVPVVALLESTNVEWAFQFLVINNKSSRVPATHTKALLARMQNTPLISRLKGARVAYDAEGIKDVDLVNNDSESPFYMTIDWPTTPAPKRIIQATAVEAALDYLQGLGVPEFEDRDVRRSVLIAIWRAVKSHWPKLWIVDSRLISKVGLICLTRLIADKIANKADEDENFESTDLEDVEKYTEQLLSKIDGRFWTTPWAKSAQGGFDTNQGRERVFAAITRLYRNGTRGVDWFDGIEIIERADAKKAK